MDRSVSASTALQVTEVTSNRSCSLSQYYSYVYSYVSAALWSRSQLTSIASEASGIHFNRRLNLLKHLVDLWKCGEEVGLKRVGT